MGLGETAPGWASATVEFMSNPTWFAFILNYTGDSLARLTTWETHWLGSLHGRLAG